MGSEDMQVAFYIIQCVLSGSGAILFCLSDAPLHSRIMTLAAGATVLCDPPCAIPRGL